MSAGSPSDGSPSPYDAPQQKGKVQAVAPVEAPGRATWTCSPLAGLRFTLSAGFLAWLLLGAIHPVFTNEKDRDRDGFLPENIQLALDRNNAILVLGLVGGLLAAGLAAGEGMSRRSWNLALGAGAGSLVVGGMLGALAGLVGFFAFRFYQPDMELSELGKTIRIQGAMLASLGAGTGAAAGILAGRSFPTAFRCAVAGLLAGLLAAIAYPVIVAILMPGAITWVLIPLDPPERLVWIGLTAALLGGIIPSVAGSRGKLAVDHAGQPPAGT